MKKVNTKHLKEAEELMNKFGYWSEQVYNYISQWNDYNSRLKIHKHLKSL